MKIKDAALCAAAVDIAKPNNIMGFFDLISNNINFSCLNLILLYQQIPDAQAVCGEKAWQALGRTINSDPKTAMLVCPEIIMKDGHFTADYKPVTVIDYASTTGENALKHYAPDDMIGAITGAANSSLEIVPSSKISDMMMRRIGAEYNEVRGIFCLSNAISNDGAKRNEAMLEAYIRYVCCVESIIEDGELYNAIRYVVFRHFGINSQGIKAIKGFLFNGLQNRTPEKILQFLCFVRAYAFDIVESLTSPMLSFEETAIVNEQLKTKDKNQFLRQLEDLHNEIEYNEWVEIIDSLHEKIEKCADDTTAKLLKQKQENGCIFTLPPYRLSINNPTNFPEIEDD